MARRYLVPAVLLLAAVLLLILIFSLPRRRQHSSAPLKPSAPPFSSSPLPPPHFPPYTPLPSPATETVTSAAASAAASLPENQPSFALSTALFVLGDSTVDSGTNNFLGTLARADRPPYGRDFDTHLPTGRFSNGRIVVDYLASFLGLPFVPPFLGQSGRIQDMIHGLNYASAASGIIFSSGFDLGQHISFTQQIQQASDTFQKLALSLGEEAAADLISRSVFYLSIGSNDFIHYYLRNVSGVQSRYQPSEFNQLLAVTMMQELENLYNANVRKLIVMGVAPIGCTPYYLWQYGNEDGKCVKQINEVVVGFNFIMKKMVRLLNRKLAGAKFAFCNAFEASMDILENHSRYGFETTTDACCGLGKYGGLIMCLMPEMACRDASTHVWWDEFHPTEAVNKILAENVWSSKHTNMCYPMNLEKMVRLDLN